MRRAAVLLVLAACGEVKNDDPDANTAAVDAAAAIDGADSDPGIDAAPSGPQDWGAPELLTQLNDPAARESAPTMSGDGLLLSFLRTTPGQRGVFLWQTQRDSVGAAWGIPTEVSSSATSFGEPELSFDGLELFIARSNSIYRSRRATRAEEWPGFTVVIDQAVSPSVQDDGLTLYGRTVSPAFPRKYTRAATTSDTWGDAGGTPFVYPDPPAGEYYAVYDVRDGLLVFSSPTSTEMPAVATVELLSTGLWGNFRAVPSLADRRTSQCDVVSKTELVCAYDSDGDTIVDELVRVTRTLDP
jgi:hypothetical protein